MILGGVFDRHPKLQVIIGHMGESLPSMLPRLDLNLPPALTKLQRPLAAYLRENLHYTFSGFNFTPTFLDLMLEVGVNRIMFSADYPYASMDEARRVPRPPARRPADRERIAHCNAGAPARALSDRPTASVGAFRRRDGPGLTSPGPHTADRGRLPRSIGGHGRRDLLRRAVGGGGHLPKLLDLLPERLRVGEVLELPLAVDRRAARPSALGLSAPSEQFQNW